MNIQWIVLDVDGVLSDGTLIYTSNGEELKSFSVKDGLGLTAARKVGLKLAIITARISYMGDDLNDLGALQIVGLPMAPNNAVPEVKELAKFISTVNGGHGAVREAVEYILKNQGLWETVVADYAREAHAHGQ